MKQCEVTYRGIFGYQVTRRFESKERAIQYIRQIGKYNAYILGAVKIRLV